MGQTMKVGTHKTSIFTIDGKTHIKYHSTVVVEFDNKRIVLNSGGWRSATTKTRMNQASCQFDLGFQVFQKDFEWFVSLPSGKTVDFSDGITIERK